MYYVLSFVNGVVYWINFSDFDKACNFAIDSCCEVLYDSLIDRYFIIPTYREA